MLKSLGTFFILLFLLSGCSTTSLKPAKKIVIWENSTPSRAYRVIGPIEIQQSIAEKNEDTIQGLAGFISNSGLINQTQIPAEMQTALQTQKMKYKTMAFDVLGEKARDYDADAVINAQYNYVPAYISFSKNASVSATGMMIEYID